VIFEGKVVGMFVERKPQQFTYARPAAIVRTFISGVRDRPSYAAQTDPFGEIPQGHRKRPPELTARDQLASLGLTLSDDGFVDVLENLELPLVTAYLTAKNDFLSKKFPQRKDKTALMISAQKGRADVVGELLKRRPKDPDGVYVNAQDLDGETALTLAVIGENGEKSIEVVKMLAEARVDLNLDLDARDNDGKTAIVWAASKGLKTVVLLLMDNGADFKPEKANRLSPLIAAAAVAGSRQPDIVQELIHRGAHKDFKNFTDGNTALIEAAVNANIENVETLVRLGVDVNQPNRSGSTALGLVRRKLKEPLRPITEASFRFIEGKLTSAGAKEK